MTTLTTQHATKQRATKQQERRTIHHRVFGPESKQWRATHPQPKAPSSATLERAKAYAALQRKSKEAERRLQQAIEASPSRTKELVEAWHAECREFESVFVVAYGPIETEEERARHNPRFVATVHFRDDGPVGIERAFVPQSASTRRHR